MRSRFIKTLIILAFLLGMPLAAFAGQSRGPDLPPGMSPEEKQKSPNPEQYPYFVREIPVAIVNAEKVDVDLKNQRAVLKDDAWVWAEQWTGPGFSLPGMEINENKRWGLNDTFIRVNPDMAPAKPSGPTDVIVAVPEETVVGDVLSPIMEKLSFKQQVNGLLKTISYIMKITEKSGDELVYDPVQGSQPALEVTTSALPAAADDFLAQPSGISPALAEKYSDALKTPFQSANGDTLYKVGDSGDYVKGRYHLMVYGDPSQSWTYPAQTEPYWDQSVWVPDKGFYRGRSWHDTLKNPAWVGKFVCGEPVAIWYNIPDLAVDGPKEVTGKPGENITFKVTCKNNKPDAQETTLAWGTDDGQWRAYDSWQPGGNPKTFALGPGESKQFDITVPVKDQPYILAVKVNYLENMPYLEASWDNNWLFVTVRPNLPNLVAVSLDPGASGEADPGAAYTATVVFRNDSSQPLTAVPVGAFNREYRAVLKDASGNEVQYTDFAPGEEKTFTFAWHAPDAGKTRLMGVINTDPLEQKYQETTYDDNKVFADVKVRDVDNSAPGDRRLNLQAYSKPGQDLYGEWQDSVARDPFTAKWTDDVHATLTVTKPTPPRGTLDWWEISWAKITYPKVADDFSFGNPVPPQGTVTKSMDVPGPGLEDQKQATITFKEDWAMDGFPVHNMMTGEDLAVYPKKYPVSVTFQVTYQYHYWICDEYGCWKVTENGGYTDTAAANLLVNGAGTILYGS